MIFHTKYTQNKFHASLHYANFFLHPGPITGHHGYAPGNTNPQSPTPTLQVKCTRPSPAPPFPETCRRPWVSWVKLRCYTSWHNSKGIRVISCDNWWWLLLWYCNLYFYFYANKKRSFPFTIKISFEGCEWQNKEIYV